MKYNKGEFVVVPSKSALQGLKPVYQTIYFWLCSYADDNMESYPSRTILASVSGVSVDTLDKGLAVLEGLGLIEKNARYRANSQQTNLYVVNIVDRSEGGAVKTTLPRRKNDPQNSIHLTQSNTTTNVVGSELLKNAVKPVYGNPEVTELIEDFQKTFDTKLTDLPKQRRYASTLIRRYGLQAAKQGVLAAAAVRAERYAPSITSIEDLHFKWDKLKSFYARNQPAGGAADITAL